MFRSIIILNLFVLMSVVSLGLASLIENADDLVSGHTEELHTPSGVILGISLLAGNLMLVLVLWMMKLVRRYPLRRNVSLGMKQWLLPTVGTLLLIFGLHLLLLPVGLEDNGQMDLFQSMKSNVLCIFLLCIVGPLTEEIVFREGILRSLVHRGLSPLSAAFVSALLFAVVHANWAQAVPALVAGFVFGILYIRADDIRLCGVAHVLNNTLAMLLLFFPAAESYMVAMNLALQLIVGAFLFIGGGVLVYCSGISVRGEKILLFPEK